MRRLKGTSSKIPQQQTYLLFLVILYTTNEHTTTNDPWLMSKYKTAAIAHQCLERPLPDPYVFILVERHYINFRVMGKKSVCNCLDWYLDEIYTCMRPGTSLHYSTMKQPIIAQII